MATASGVYERRPYALDVRVGDEVYLLPPRGPSTALETAPRVTRYPVVAIFEIGMSEYDASILFKPLKEAQLYVSAPDRVTVLELSSNHIFEHTRPD